MKKDVLKTILVSPEPRGRQKGCIVSGTPKPGTIMQVKAATEPVGGLFTYEAYNRGADAERPQGAYAVLLEDALQGLTIDGTYVSGAHGFVYHLLPGDEILGLCANAAGTDVFAIGDLLIVDDGTGKLLATTGTPESEPFTVMETVSAVWSADTLVHMMFTGY